MSNKSELERIMRRRILDEELEGLWERDHLGTMLVWMMTSNKPPYLMGFDSSTIMHWLGIFSVGSCRHAYDVDWICVPHISGSLMPVPGRKVSSTLFLQALRGRTALVWIPTGALVDLRVNATAVEANAVELSHAIEQVESLTRQGGTQDSKAAKVLHNRIRSLCRLSVTEVQHARG